VSDLRKPILAEQAAENIFKSNKSKFAVIFSVSLFVFEIFETFL
jgi:hypothetical protein